MTNEEKSLKPNFKQLLVDRNSDMTRLLEIFNDLKDYSGKVDVALLDELKTLYTRTIQWLNEIEEVDVLKTYDTTDTTEEDLTACQELSLELDEAVSVLKEVVADQLLVQMKYN